MNALAEEYFAAEARPAPRIHDFRKEMTGELNSKNVNILVTGNDDQVQAFVIPNLLTETECDDIICSAENHGIVPAEKSGGTLRTARRTAYYENAELSDRLFERLQDNLQCKFIMSDYFGNIYGIHSNWRVLRYDVGDSFCAHQDQMDSMQVRNDDGTKDLIVSSHTLLIQLTNVESGGATRFYPNSKIKSGQKGQYDEAIDVYLPKGWGMAFRQRGLVHAGQPVVKGIKYVAQAGILRKPPITKTIQPSLFRMAPGLEGFLEEQNQDEKTSKHMEEMQN